MNRIPFGDIFGFYWFFLLFLAGITSSISLMQPIVSFLEDELGWNRHKAALTLGIVCFVVSHACIFGLGAGVLDEFDFWGGTLMITLCAFIEVMVFMLYVGVQRGWEELHRGGDIRLPNILKNLLYVTPFYLGGIIVCWAVMDWLPWILKPFGIGLTLRFASQWPFVAHSITHGELQPVILWTRAGLLALLIALVALIHIAWRRARAHKEAV